MSPSPPSHLGGGPLTPGDPYMRMRWLARLLLPIMKRRAAARDPDFRVFRNGEEAVYLNRWWQWPRNNLTNCYLHNMIRDDDPILHDHPYWFVSIMLDGELRENYSPTPAADVSALGRVWERSRILRAGDIVFRSSTMAHQLVVRREAWTLMISGRRVREWGFWCPKGWREWYKYVATNQDPSQRGNAVGRGTSGRGVGCGEP